MEKLEGGEQTLYTFWCDVLRRTQTFSGSIPAGNTQADPDWEETSGELNMQNTSSQ